MDWTHDGTVAVIAAFSALLVQALIRLWRDQNPEILTPGRLRAYGLPYRGNDVKRFKRIFTFRKEKRIRIAEEHIKRLGKEKSKIASQIENHQEKYSDNISQLNSAQEKVRDADTKGQRQTDAQAYLVPVLHDTGVNLMTIGSNTSIAVIISKEIAFWEQVAMGLNRIQVNDNLTDPEGITQKMDTFMPEALKAARQTLSLGETEYEKTVEFWIEQF